MSSNDSSRRSTFDAPLPKDVQAWTQTRWWTLCPDILGVIDPDGRFVETNPAWQTLLGWSAAELKSVPFFEYLHPDDLEKTVAERNSVTDGNICMRFRNRYIMNDGTYKTVEWIAINDGDYILCQGRVSD